MYERIPEELKAVRQWHCWALRGDVKIPIQVDGSNAKSNDPETWSDFETAAGAAAFHSGLSFELSEPWTGVDLDDCIDDNGLKAWAIEILARFDGLGFAEVSPSGTGIKIITRGRKTAGSRCLHKHSEGQIECYDHARFWTITDDLYNGQDEIHDGQQAVDWLCNKFLIRTEPKPVPVQPVQTTVSSLQKRAASYLQSVTSAGEGDRNNAAFRLAGQLHAFVGDNGERLTDSEIKDLMSEWNSRNSPPLPESELKTAASSAKRNGTPRPDKPPKPNAFERPDYLNVDISKLIGETKPDDIDDDEFCKLMVPEFGMIREVYDYYSLIAHRHSNIMGLAVAMSLCETVFGRRICSHTNLRTNDYNVIMAPTSSGKEACETAIVNIFQAADSLKMPLIPPDVQSGNGLVKALSSMPCALWVCDEFGKTLEAILDKKSNNGHAKLIGTHLLKLYGKSHSHYGGAAHADGLRNQINQPHLVLLGLTTGQVFDSIDSKQIQDGLFGRLAFWPVQDRPERRTMRIHDVPERLTEMVREWIGWEPFAAMAGHPRPEVIEMTPEAMKRWEDHSNDIDKRMSREHESRSAIWGRAAARTMKLAVTHRAARICDRPSVIDWKTSVRIEKQDIEWSIRLSNWLARVSCGLIGERVVDTQALHAKNVILMAVEKLGSVGKSELLRSHRSVSGSEFTAAAEELETQGHIRVTQEKTIGRSRVIFSKPETTVQATE